MYLSYPLKHTELGFLLKFVCKSKHNNLSTLQTLVKPIKCPKTLCCYRPRMFWARSLYLFAFCAFVFVSLFVINMFGQRRGDSKSNSKSESRAKVGY